MAEQLMVAESVDGVQITNLQSINKGCIKKLYFMSLKNQVLRFENLINLINLDSKRRTVTNTEKDKIRDGNPTVGLQFTLLKADGSTIDLSSNTVNGKSCEEPAFYIHLLNGLKHQSFDDMIPFVLLSFNYPPTAFGTSHYILRIESTGTTNAQTELKIEFRKVLVAIQFCAD